MARNLRSCSIDDVICKPSVCSYLTELSCIVHEQFHSHE